MIYQIVYIRDIVADVAGTPQFVVSIGGAIRAFGDQCKDKNPQNLVGQHPSDFEMWHVGEYDDNTGTITPFEPLKRKQIAVGANYTETK